MRHICKKFALCGIGVFRQLLCLGKLLTFVCFLLGAYDQDDGHREGYDDEGYDEQHDRDGSEGIGLLGIGDGGGQSVTHPYRDKVSAETAKQDENDINGLKDLRQSGAGIRVAFALADGIFLADGDGDQNIGDVADKAEVVIWVEQVGGPIKAGDGPGCEFKRHI